MLKDITLGQYYQTDSIIHRLDPRVKIIGTIIYIVMLFLANSVAGYGLVALALILCIRASKVPVRFIVKGLKAIVMLLIITVIFNMFLTPGEVLVSVWKLSISKEGVKTAVTMALRLSMLIMGSSIMTLTTTPNQLTDALETLLRPLKVIHVPVHEIAMMMSIALRFIPILMEETDKIMKAQMARGADFESGNIIMRAKSLIPLLVPLFVSAFRRANDLAMAMEARCYQGGDRTRMKPLRYKKADFCGYTILIVMLVMVILLRVFGTGPLI